MIAFGTVVSEPEAYVRSTQGQRDKLAFRVGLRHALQNPWLTAKRGLVKFSNFWGLERELVGGELLGRRVLPRLLLA